MAKEYTKKMELSNSIISTFKNNNYSVSGAIAEFIDNSTQSFYDNEEKLRKENGNPRVDVILHKKKSNHKNYSSLKIVDNAYGMNPNQMLEAMDIGNTKEKRGQEVDRGEFGMGLKTAGFWFCNEWTLLSKTPDSKKTYEIYINEDQAVKPNYSFLAEESIYGIGDYKSGTEISLDSFNSRRKVTEKQMENLVFLMASTYRKDINEKNLEIRFAIMDDNFPGKYRDVGKMARNEEDSDENVWLDSLTEVEPVSWKKPKIAKNNNKDVSQKFNIEIEEEDGTILTGKVEISCLETGNSKMAGISFIRNNRVIEGGYEDSLKPKVIFGNGNSFEYQRVFIEIFVNQKWPVTQQKDSLALSPDQKSELYDQIKAKGKKTISFARDRRVNSNGEKIKKSINEESNYKIAEKINTIKDLIENNSNIKLSYKQIDKYNAEWEVELTLKKKKEKYNIETNLFVDKSIDRDWLEIKVRKGTYHFEMNLGHEFFNPYSEEAKYLDLLHQMTFYILFSEFLVSVEKELLGTSHPNSYRKYINKLFNHDINEK